MKIILKDLSALIRKSTLHYSEACSQEDVSLTEDFKRKFRDYLLTRDSNIDFYQYTAVAVTSMGNNVFIPNQWFVLAAYAAGVYTELQKYKEYLLKVCKQMSKAPKTFIPHLRNGATLSEHSEFMKTCRTVFEGYDEETTRLAADRLWRFATDYSWWCGSKTIDRTDFYFSVIMNMLNLQSVSQTYVGEIVGAYSNGRMMGMVAELSDFTENLEGPTYVIEDYADPKEVTIKVTAEEKKPEYTEINGMISLTTRRNKHS